MSDNIKIRRGQLITTHGIGSLINATTNESFIIAGLDMWNKHYGNEPEKYQEFIVQEPRLAKRLQIKEFRIPPDFRRHGEGLKNEGLTIPVVRFPGWHYCPYCGFMFKLDYYESDNKCRNDECHGKKSGKNYLLPVRFITVCEAGHIDDFPFQEWVHYGKGGNNFHQLKYNAKGSSNLSGVTIECQTCDSKANLRGAFSPGALPAKGINCRGARPWLGDPGSPSFECSLNETYTGNQKGASNVYFPSIYSAIYIPGEEELRSEQANKMESLWPKLEKLISIDLNGELSNTDVIRFLAEEQGIAYEPAAIYARRKLSIEDAEVEEKIISETDFRFEEYDAFINKRGSASDDFFTRPVCLAESRELGQYVDSVILVEKLKETRSLVGFSRLVPDDGLRPFEKRKNLSVNRYDWLPCVEIRGEGVFFTLNPEKVEAWEQRVDVSEHFSTMRENYLEYKYRKKNKIISPTFVLLHSLAHALIRELSYECGYGSSALNEKIFYSGSTERKMMGVLIYTASGDSEGSLGGLVSQGNPELFNKRLRSAIERVKWCSSDPVCMNLGNQGPGGCNGAACHNCLLLPETACEEFNILLDRALLIGSMDNPELGFFNEMIRYGQIQI